MTGNERPGTRILGNLRSAGGKGVVRMEDRVDADVAEVWSALTDPSRLARWYGEVEGELRLGGEYRARLSGSGGRRRVALAVFPQGPAPSACTINAAGGSAGHRLMRR
jgi:carbon monoxide dehydrogenase subunit G